MVHEGFLCVFSVRERHSHVRTDEARTKEHILLDTNTGKTGLSTYGIKPHRQEQKDETRTKDERRKKVPRQERVMSRDFSANNLSKDTKEELSPCHKGHYSGP